MDQAFAAPKELDRSAIGRLSIQIAEHEVWVEKGSENPAERFLEASRRVVDELRLVKEKPEEKKGNLWVPSQIRRLILKKRENFSRLLSAPAGNNRVEAIRSLS